MAGMHAPILQQSLNPAAADINALINMIDAIQLGISETVSNIHDPLPAYCPAGGWQRQPTNPPAERVDKMTKSAFGKQLIAGIWKV